MCHGGAYCAGVKPKPERKNKLSNILEYTLVLTGEVNDEKMGKGRMQVNGSGTVLKVQASAVIKFLRTHQSVIKNKGRLLL